MSRNIVFEGWLTKSPPSKRIWRTKWRRRWFALRQSGELPGQYFLDYYADRSSRRLKGTINLDLCEQVDAGLHMERSGNNNGQIDPKLRGSVFTIQTQSRTYHLEADCEAEMEKWVDAICRVCGLRSTEETDDGNDVYQMRTPSAPVYSPTHTCAPSTGPYIPISECVTGVRAQEQETTFTFDPRNIVVSQTSMCDKATDTGETVGYRSPPQIRITNADFSENESNLSDEDSKSLNPSCRIDTWEVTKTFKRLAVKPKPELSEEGPPVPPRPPKSVYRAPQVVKEPIQTTKKGPKIQEPVESVEESIAKYTGPGTPWLRIPQRAQKRRTPRSPVPARLYTYTTNNMRYTDDEEEFSVGSPTTHYYNVPSLPPAIDRTRKPRNALSSVGNVNSYAPQLPPRNNVKAKKTVRFELPAEDPEPIYSEIIPTNVLPSYPTIAHIEQRKSDTLQYLDLDLHTTSQPAKNFDVPRKEDIVRGCSASADDEPAYKTVDFIMTDALTLMQQDAEALRSFQH